MSVDSFLVRLHSHVIFLRVKYFKLYFDLDLNALCLFVTWTSCALCLKSDATYYCIYMFPYLQDSNSDLITQKLCLFVDMKIL